MSLPALILIPGAYTPHTVYNSFLPLLSAYGIEVYALPLQSVGRRPLPAPHMYDDAAFIAAEIRKLVDVGKRVVLLGHSYGGVPISQCTKGLTVKERAAEGKKGGIARLVYLTAVVPRPGETASGEAPGDLAGAGYHSHYLSFDPELALRFTLSDIPREKALSLGVSLEMSAVTQVDALTWAGYKDVPSTYIVTKQDQALTVDRQQVAIEVLREFAPDEGGPEILDIDSGHAPNISKPEELAKMLKGIVERAK